MSNLAEKQRVIAAADVVLGDFIKESLNTPGGGVIRGKVVTMTVRVDGEDLLQVAAIGVKADGEQVNLYEL